MLLDALNFPRTRILRKNLALWFAQRRRCFLCGGVILDLDAPHPRSASEDHVRPRVKGHTKQGNILLACSVCNQRKGQRDPHPCEIIYLDAMNAIMGRQPPIWSRSDERA